MGPKKEGFSHSHIAYESQLIVLLLHFGKKKLAKESSSCMMHDLIFMIFVWYPLKKYLTHFFPLRFFQPFFRHPIHPGRRKNPAFWDPGLWCTQRHLSQQPNGLGSVGWEDHVGHVGIPHWVGRLWLHTPNCIVMWWTKRFLIFLASNYLRKTWVFQWWLTLLLRLHTSDVGVHVLPHLPSREALRCPPWHLRCFVHKEKLVTKRAET